MSFYPRIRDLREDNDLPTSLVITLADYYKTTTDYILGRTNNPNVAKE